MNGIERIQMSFSKQKAFIAYLTAGDGGMDATYDAACALIAGGVNMLEIGVPFSDPVADGEVIQKASERALQAGTTLTSVFALIKKLRQVTDIPLILFSYFNPILAFQDEFFNAAITAGVDGVLIVDCPFEESTSFFSTLQTYQIAPIYVLAPSTPVARIKQINSLAQGFLYYACRSGTTGVRAQLPDDFASKIATIKKNVNLPVVVGFGIASEQAAAQVLQYADGAVVGSFFVKARAEGATDSELTALAHGINPIKRSAL